MLHLCTEEKTLECKYVETTNSLYLVEAAGQSQVRNLYLLLWTIAVVAVCILHSTAFHLAISQYAEMAYIQGEGDENDQRNNRSQQPHTAIAGAGLMSQMEADMSAKHVTPLHVEAHTNFVVEVRHCLR